MTMEGGMHGNHSGRPLDPQMTNVTSGVRQLLTRKEAYALQE